MWLWACAKKYRKNVGLNKSVTMADQAKLPYCRAVMYEVIRASVTFIVPPRHIFSEDIEVNGYTLPKDAWLIPALCTINLDPTIFPEPEKFKPERFIDVNGKLAGYEKVYTQFLLGKFDEVVFARHCSLMHDINYALGVVNYYYLRRS
jgi:cytochrome P450